MLLVIKADIILQKKSLTISQFDNYSSV